MTYNCLVTLLSPSLLTTCRPHTSLLLPVVRGEKWITVTSASAMFTKACMVKWVINFSRGTYVYLFWMYEMSDLLFATL